MHPRLDELLTFAEDARSALLATIAEVPPEHHAVVPPTGGWSVSHVLQHLYLVEHGSVRAMFRALKTAQAQGVDSERETSSLLDRIVSMSEAMDAGGFQAPAFTQPESPPDVTTLLAQLSDSRKALLAWAAAADGVALDTIYFPHPRFGELSLYGWVIMLGTHERHHTRQIERIARAVRA